MMQPSSVLTRTTAIQALLPDPVGVAGLLSLGSRRGWRLRSTTCEQEATRRKWAGGADDLAGPNPTGDEAGERRAAS